MESRKRKRNIQAILHRDSGRRFSFKFGVITIAFIAIWSKCEAQCSTPSANFIASRNPQFLYAPSYHISYRKEARCSWLITSPTATAKIQLRVVDDYFSCCCNDEYLLIRDGSDSSAVPIAILCSELNPISITSSGFAIFGEFRTKDAGGRLSGRRYKLEFDYFDSDASCPSGWIERDGYCYKLYDEVVPWQQAASRCGYDGGFLTSIVDKEENKFLVDSFQCQSSEVWIGMDSAGNWLDGSNSSYDNFGIDSSSISMGCAITDLDDGGRWRVEDCSDQSCNKFICKKTRDGDGGRYWTEITIKGEESGAWFVILMLVLIVGICGFIGVARLHRNRDDRFGKLVCCLCLGLYTCLRSAFVLCNRISEEEQTSGTTFNYLSVRYQASRTVQISRRSSAALASTSACGDVTASFLPPPYHEAFVARCDCGPPGSEAIKSPSYESVVGSALE